MLIGVGTIRRFMRRVVDCSLYTLCVGIGSDWYYRWILASRVLLCRYPSHLEHSNRTWSTATKDVSQWGYITIDDSCLDWDGIVGNVIGLYQCRLYSRLEATGCSGCESCEVYR